MNIYNSISESVNFSDEEIQAVWEKGMPVPGYAPSQVRKDCYGAWIERAQYGNRKSRYGWEIDHVLPKAKGGSDDISNLQPLQWENNCKKGDRIF